VMAGSALVATIVASAPAAHASFVVREKPSTGNTGVTKNLVSTSPAPLVK
jgi:hypothetical protein